MSENFSVKSLNTGNIEEVSAAAELNSKLVGYGYLPRLGRFFMTRFYYFKLVKAGIIKCDLCEYQGKFIGYIVYTKFAATVMEEAVKRCWLNFGITLILSLLQNPLRIRTVFELMFQNKARNINIDAKSTGEILSFGVLEEFAGLKNGKTGLRVSAELFEKACAYFKKEKINTVQADVRKNNLKALFFYKGYDAEITESPYDPGESYLARARITTNEIN